MPKDLRMPTVQELPEGPRRAFVAEMFSYYRAGNRPTLAMISTRIRQHDALPGTASSETIRRILRGHTVPGWNTVSSVFLVLCELSGISPDEDAYEDSGYGGYQEQIPSRRAQLNQLWNEAKDSPPSVLPVPQQPPDHDEPPF